MHTFYIFTLLTPPLLVGMTLLFWGLESNKDQEVMKGWISRLVFWLQFFLGLWALFFLSPVPELSITFVHLKHYHYDLLFGFERYQFFLSSVFALIFILVEKVSFRYLHAEEEHAKFYGLKMFFNLAVMIFIYSTNIDMLFFSWEVVGLSSALLISYFYKRNQAVEHSLYAYSIYRLCDAAFLFTCLLLFYFYNTESILTSASGMGATAIGFCIFLSIMGKSGLYPFSSWLPLALEGPTPSSNLYYMTVSTHLGAVYLIKTIHLWESSIIVKSIMIIMGFISFMTSYLSSRVQPSIKTEIAYSTLSQVALIIIEIALGYKEVALAHLTLHLLYRFAQMTNSASIIDQIKSYESLIGVDRSIPQSNISYWLALNGHSSERIVIKIFKLFLIPFLMLEKIENHFHKKSHKKQ